MVAQHVLDVVTDVVPIVEEDVLLDVLDALVHVVHYVMGVDHLVVLLVQDVQDALVVHHVILAVQIAVLDVLVDAILLVEDVLDVHLDVKEIVVHHVVHHAQKIVMLHVVCSSLEL